MKSENIGTLVNAIVQLIAAAVLVVIAYMFNDFFSTEFSRIFVVLILGAFMLWPVRYRKIGEGWVRIPFPLAGFCELAIVVFDRFKPVDLAKLQAEHDQMKKIIQERLNINMD